MSTRRSPMLPLLLALLVLGAIGLALERSHRTPATPSGSDAPPVAPREIAGYTLHEPGSPWREVRREGAVELTLPTPPRRIVSMSLGTDQILLAICPADRVVGLSRLALDPKFSKVVPLVRTMKAAIGGSAEHLLSLEPDLVLAASYTPAAKVAQLRSAGVPILRLDRFNSIERIRHNIRLVGFCADVDAAAEALIGKMDARLRAAAARVPERATKLRVLWHGFGQVLGADTTFHDAVELAGAINIPATHGLTGWPKVGEEQIATWDPDVILISHEDGDPADAVAAYLKAHPVIADTRAAREGRVVSLPSATMTTVSHHIVDLAEAVVGALYPGK